MLLFIRTLKRILNFTLLSNISGLKDLISQFVVAAKDGKSEEDGWAPTAYGMSKVGISLVTKLHQDIFDQEPEKRNIIINSCCPGNVFTDMSSGKHPNPLTPDEGADTPTYLALIPQDATEPKGKFCKLRKPVPYPPIYSKK